MRFTSLGFTSPGFKRPVLAIAMVIAASQAWGQAAPSPAVEALLANPKIVKALDDIKADDARTFEEQKRMQELGFKDAAVDSEGNVIALRKGSGGGRPKLVVSAHLDTVFPEGTDVAVKERDGAIVAPGIGDDSRGLAALLSLIKSMNAHG